MSIETTPVRAGQVWADNDPRVPGRTLRVDDVRDGTAHCTILTNDHESQARIDQTGHSGPTGRYVNGTWVPGDRRGTTTRIRVTRMRPIGTGYRLLTDAPD